MRYLKKALCGILTAIDWFFIAVSASRRPTTRDDANARYGLDTLDPMGERVGREGPRPGDRPPPAD
jgi:hypothetical protein